MNKRHYEHTLPNIRGSLSNTYYNPITQSVTFRVKVYPHLHYGKSAKNKAFGIVLQIYLG